MAPTMVVRVAGNVEDLKRAMVDGERTVQAATGKILQFTGATEKAVPAGKQVAAAYREVDGVLQSLGINVGPYVKGLEDIVSLASKGTAGLGLFGSAALVVGTAIGSWKLGERIGELTGWTEAIARGTAVLRGYGDVQQEEMLARHQSIELAGQAEANWKRQAEGTEAATKAAKEHTEEMQRSGLVGAGNAAQMEALANQLDAVKEKRVKDAEATRLAAHEQFFYGEKAHFTTEVIVEQTKALDDHLKKIAEAAAAEKQRISDFMNAPTLNGRDSAVTSYNVPSLTRRAIDQIQLSYTGTMDGDPTAALKAKLAQLESMTGYYKITNNRDFFAMQDDKVLLSQLRQYFESSGRAFASGVSNYGGGMALVGERGPELVNLPPGSDVIPNHRIGGGVNIAITVMGNVQTEQDLVQCIKNGLMRDLSASLFLHPPPS